MNWKEFQAAAPELAETGEKLFEYGGVVLIGTIRADGSPRISPVEPLFADGQLYLGMMWQSLKARDLLRDPRCTIHNLISDRHAKDGEFKIQGRAVDVQDETRRKHYCDALREKIGWSPEGLNFHLFAIEVQSAAFFITDGDARLLKKWRAGESIKAFRQGMDDKLIPVE